MILVATRSMSLRDGLLALLAAINPAQPIEFVDDIAVLLTAVTQAPIDLIVLDADLPTVSTGMVSGQIKQASPHTRILILTDLIEPHDSPSHFEADAVLLKGIAATDMANTIERLLAH
ncbi:MAG: hypothetical protein U0559_15185 [Anaerolineae bacterium]